MASQLVLLALASFVAYTDAVVPVGYILEVFPFCGKNTSDDPYIMVVTDLETAVNAECDNGIFHFNNTDDVNFYLPVSFKGRNSSLCEFKKRNNSETYVVKVTMSFGETGQLVAMDDEEYTVSCTYDPSTSFESYQHTIQDPLIAPPEIQQLVGPFGSNSTLTMQITDVLGGDITGQQIDIGRWVQLRATTDGGSGEVGIRPIGCNVVANTTTRTFAIIRGGCGDGVVFEKDMGFEISGLTTVSPYFPAFHIADDEYFSFECNVTLCTTNCDGSSCASERDRRDVDIQDISSEPEIYIHLKTAVFHLREDLHSETDR